VSDVRDKCIFGAVPHGRCFLQGITPIEFSLKDRATGELIDEPSKRRYGFSAQEIRELEGDKKVLVSDLSEDKLGLTDSYLIPILVNAIKELNKEIDNMKERISILENPQ
jgi:hypothetical protein